MAITLSGDHAVPGPPLSARLTTPQVWGIVLLTPYILVFLAFVVYRSEGVAGAASGELLALWPIRSRARGHS